MIRFADLFCGIGGFHLAMEAAASERGLKAECVFASDIDLDCQKAYAANFGMTPAGDIARIDADAIPDIDLLFGGFPCQPFSIIGDRKGFEDDRGGLIFETIRILKAKRPAAFVLENVKSLASHQGGDALKRILDALEEIGYRARFKVLNALDFGVPQKRERIFIVGFREETNFQFPEGEIPMKPLSEILEIDVPTNYVASELIQKKRMSQILGKSTPVPSIWHENKGGNVGVHEYSCALRAGASYNYLLVNGERRLTEREMLRLQGFPDDYEIVGGYAALRKQAGNSVAVPCVSAVIGAVLDALNEKERNFNAI